MKQNKTLASLKLIITSHKRSFGQGNVFTPVILLTGGGVADISLGRHPAGQKPPWADRLGRYPVPQ